MDPALVYGLLFFGLAVAGLALIVFLLVALVRGGVRGHRDRNLSSGRVRSLPFWTRALLLASAAVVGAGVGALIASVLIGSVGWHPFLVGAAPLARFGPASSS